jgi:hypothetical protein
VAREVKGWFIEINKKAIPSWRNPCGIAFFLVNQLTTYRKFLHSIC